MSFEGYPLEEVMRDLQSRFIINVPKEELAAPERLYFQLEQAHWFYQDFIAVEGSIFKKMKLKKFITTYFEHCPALKSVIPDYDLAMKNFMDYRTKVPVCGAILISDDLKKVALVRGCKPNSAWHFPRGKINKNESESECAIREVLEETGFDISSYLEEDRFAEITKKEQRIRLYIITGVPSATIFQTKTRNEIGEIKWHDVISLPGWEDKKFQKDHSSDRYYLIKNFMPTIFQSIVNSMVIKREESNKRDKFVAMKRNNQERRLGK